MSELAFWLRKIYLRDLELASIDSDFKSQRFEVSVFHQVQEQGNSIDNTPLVKLPSEIPSDLDSNGHELNFFRHRKFNSFHVRVYQQRH